jgi:hypothetical protein
MVRFNVSHENGVDQYYRLDVPPNLPPAKPETGKISQKRGRHGTKLPQDGVTYEPGQMVEFHRIC